MDSKNLRSIAALMIFAAISVCVLEGALRVVPLIINEPTRSLIQEAKRIPFSNARTVPGGMAITLPPEHHADIAVIGDSFPFGTYEKAEDIFPTLLGKQFSTVNLAVGSNSPPHYNRMLEIATRYSPRLVIYCIFANDFLNDADFEPRDLSIENARRAMPEDAEKFRENESSHEKVKRAIRSVANLSLSYQLLKLFQQPHPKTQTIPWYQGENFFMFAPTSFWDKQVSIDDPNVKRGISKLVSVVDKAAVFTRTQLKADFMVLMLPTKEMVYGPLAGNIAPKIFNDSHYATYLALEAGLNKKGIQYLDITATLRAMAYSGIKLYHSIDGHFNQEGHRVTTAALTPVVTKLLQTRQLAKDGK